MTIMPTPNVLFLGFCSRAQCDSSNLRWNVIGLSSVVHTYIFPCNPPPYLAVSVNFETFDESADLHFLDDEDSLIAKISIQREFVDINNADHADGEPENLKSIQSGEGWTVLFLPFGTDAPTIMKPGHYSVVQLRNGTPIHIGRFQFEHLEAPPLTKERLDAIRSDPKASKVVRIRLGCRDCGSKYRAYFGLDRDKEMETEGWCWSPNITEQEFHCSCGATRIELSHLRSGLAAFLGKHSSDASLDLVPLYEKSSLQKVHNRFLKLLNTKPVEEEIQQFIAKNPILLHMFSAVKLVPKPSIGTRYRADFAILDARGDLVLIELERANIKLMKRDGHRAQELVHAFDQVGDWLLKFGEHRLSVLDDLNIKTEEVHNVRGVVIAGRETGYEASHMRNLKRRPNDGILFMTYDDLLAAIDTLIQNFESS